MSVQLIIVIAIIAAAVIYTGRSLMRKRHAFSPKAGCGDDCGCNTPSKKLPS